MEERLEEFYGREIWELATEFYNEQFPINISSDNTTVDNSAAENLDGTVDGHVDENAAADIEPAGSVMFAIDNEESNFDYANLQTASYSNLNTGDIFQSRQHYYSNSYPEAILPPLTPQNSNFQYSTSLPATPLEGPLSLASTSSSNQILRSRKQVRRCCKEMKAWLIEQPRNLHKVRQILSQYSVEINEALNMRSSRSGRPHVNQGALTAEKRDYFRLNYDITKRCKIFIASFVNMHYRGLSATMSMEDLQYPSEIDSNSRAHRYTQ